MMATIINEKVRAIVIVALGKVREWQQPYAERRK
jgi:hypothetical protein